MKWTTKCGAPPHDPASPVRAFVIYKNGVFIAFFGGFALLIAGLVGYSLRG